MVKHGIELDSPAIQEFCRRWKIRELGVFGSVLGEDFRSDSDLDFLADFEEDAEWDLSDAQDMREELAHIVGRDVDMITRFALESSRNWLFRKRVLATLQTVYASR